MNDLEPMLTAIRRETDPNRKNLRVAERLRVADSSDYRVGAELRALLAEAEAKEDAGA